MKFRLMRDYWTEFVCRAYLNHQTEAISLAGSSGVPESPSTPRSTANDTTLPR